MIANPPASTGARSGFNAHELEPSRRGPRRSCACAAARGPRGVMPPDDSRSPRGSPRARAPCPTRRRPRASARARTRARSPRFPRARPSRPRERRRRAARPSAKKRCVKLTQPSFSDSSRSGSMPRPMMNSVDPPPMSMTSRGSSRRRQHVRDAEVDETRFLVAADDVDRKAERRFRLRQELRRVARDAERVRRDRAHGRRMQAAQPLAEAREARERRRCARRREVAAAVDARAEAQRLAPRVEPEDLVALDAPDLEPEAVAAHVDDSERRRAWRAAGAGAWHDAGRCAAIGDQATSVGRRRCASPAPARAPAPYREFRAASLARAHAHRLPAEDPDREGLRRRDRDAARAGADAVAPARQPRAAEARGPAAACSRSSCAARTTRWRTCPPAERARGVIAASAGNHAQGVALAAQRLGCPATIVMPVTTPHIKIAAVEARGATVRAARRLVLRRLRRGAARCRRSRGATFVHPYDDPDVIAGQGTIGMEILRQWPGPLDAIFVAIGGGGLIAGIAAYMKRVRPEVQDHRRAARRLRRDGALARRRAARRAAARRACSPTASR